MSTHSIELLSGQATKVSHYIKNRNEPKIGRLEAWQLGIRVLHSLENSLDVACKKINKMTLGRLLLQNLRQCIRCVQFCYLTASEPSLSFTVGVGLAGLYFPVGVYLSFDAVTHKHRQHRRSTVTLEGAL